MAGMTRKQVRMTNGVANTLVNKHGMCLDCAIKFAERFVCRERPEHDAGFVEFCCEACAGAMMEFLLTKPWQARAGQPR
jgi:hypothetical protein